MNLLFYSSSGYDVGEHLWNLYRNMPENMNTVFCRTIPSLSSALIKSIGEPKIAVILASNQEELKDILFLRELLHSYRIILILPDNEGETIRKAHTLFPRFLTFMDNEIEHVGEVLKKMLTNYKRTEKWYYS
jgi:hypothetical protein